MPPFSSIYTARSKLAAEAGDSSPRLGEDGGISPSMLGANRPFEQAKKTATSLRFSMEALQFAIRVDWQVVSFSKEA